MSEYGIHSKTQCLALYHRMHMIRAFEESVIHLFNEGRISGTTHPSIGQEAIAVGACSVLETNDLVLATYRGHGQAIAKGSDPKFLMAEVLTRTTGCCKGRGGSMHLCDKTKGLLGTNAIVGAHIPIAGGVALANKLKNSRQVTVCFFGDGASCEGEFSESLNLMALWKVPIVLICENNGYAMSVPVKLSQCTEDIADRVSSFGIPASVVDGNDVLAVQAKTAEFVAHARQGKGPAMIECKTVRWERHSAFSAGKYDNPEEAQRWKAVDPIPRFAKQLRQLGITEAELNSQEADARAIIKEAVKFALESPHPAPESVYEGIFAEADIPRSQDSAKTAPIVATDQE